MLNTSKFEIQKINNLKNIFLFIFKNIITL